MIKKITIIYSLLLCICSTSNAQSEWMIDRCHFVSCDITMSPPDGFNVDTTSTAYTASINPDFYPSDAIPGSKIGSFYMLAFVSNDEDCLLLYPTNLGLSLSGMPDAELKACAGNENIDTKDQILVVAQNDMSAYCNADTSYIYRMKLPTPYLGKYPNCVGICLRKYAHPAMLMKIMLTDEGLASEDKYLKTLLSSISYGDEPKEEWKKKEILFTELMHPNRDKYRKESHSSEHQH